MKLQTQHRYWAISLVVAITVVALLSIVLRPGYSAAVLLLDHYAPGTDVTFPFPFTIQILMIMLWALGIGEAFFRFREPAREEHARGLRLLPEDERTVLVESDLPGIRQRALADVDLRASFLCSSVDQCIIHFQANKAADQSHHVLSSLLELEMHRVDLRYTLLRYLSWLLPTIGFIGTVIGIALSLKFIGLHGVSDLTTITQKLGIAFNTTIMALVMSSVLVFFTQFAQRREETAINASADYCLRNLINRLYVP